MFRVLWLLFRKKGVTSMVGNRGKVVLIFLCLIWYSTSGYLFFELPKKPDLGWLDALWWTLVTMATVGYGDYFPVSAGGRYLVGVPTMVFGIGFLGFIISEVASNLIESQSRRLQGMLNVKSRNHIIIVNFSRLDEIMNIIEELRLDPTTREKDICLIDEKLETIPQRLHEEGVCFVRGNPTEEATLRQANLEQASNAIILSRDRSDPHSDDQNLVTTLVIEKLNPDIFTIAEVLDPQKIRQFELAGCNSVICVSQFAANLIIQELQDPGLKDILTDLMSNREGSQIYFVDIKKMREWKYRELVLWGLDNRFSVIGLMRDGAPLLGCAADDSVRETDRVIMVGERRVSRIEL